MYAVGAEPTSHRIIWADIDGDERKELVNAPIMGRNAKAPLWEVAVNLIWYEIPEQPTLAPWEPHIIDDQLTVVHGISVIDWDNDGCDDILVASFEGIHLFQPQKQAKGVSWTKTKLGVGDQVNREKRGPSEIAAGKIGSEETITISRGYSCLICNLLLFLSRQQLEQSKHSTPPRNNCYPDILTKG